MPAGDTSDGVLGDVVAAILAGGLGTRLKNVVSDRPKALACVAGRPFLAHQFEQLASAGVRRVVLCTGHRAEQVSSAFGDRYGELRLDYSHERTPLGTGGALRLALPLLASDNVLVLNGDSYCEADLLAFARWHFTRQAGASMLLTHVDDMSRFGRVTFDPEGAIVGFEEKGAHHGAGWINAGVYLIRRSWLYDVAGDRPVSLEREVFPSWIGRGFCGYASEGRFIDIGTPESYAAADEVLRAVASQ